MRVATINVYRARTVMKNEANRLKEPHPSQGVSYCQLWPWCLMDVESGLPGIKIFQKVLKYRYFIMKSYL